MATLRLEQALDVPLATNDDRILGGDIDDVRIVVVEKGQGHFAEAVRIRFTVLNWCARATEPLLRGELVTAECNDSDPLQASFASSIPLQDR